MLLGTLFNIANILAGVLLGASALDKIDGDTNIFNKLAKVLTPFNLIIGGFCLGLGILFLIQGGGILYDLVGILSGLLLLAAVLTKVPAVGDTLATVVSKLSPFKVIIGVAAFAAGILGILGIGLF